MASTSAAEPSEAPNWMELPDNIMRMALERLSAVEILNSVQKVCTTWQRVCKDQKMWKAIHIRYFWDVDYDVEKLTKEAVHRSCGELVDVNLERFGNDDLIDYISRCSSKLNRLRLMNCYDMTGSGLSHAVKRLPHLETLELFFISISAEDIEVIGCSCPGLKSLKLNKRFRRSDIECNGDASAIANSMPALCHLQLFGNKMTNDGLHDILNGCRHLESLDLRRCFYLDIRGNIRKLCVERLKDFKCPHASTADCGFNPYDSTKDCRFPIFADTNSHGYSDVDVDDLSSED